MRSKLIQCDKCSVVWTLALLVLVSVAAGSLACLVVNHDRAGNEREVARLQQEKKLALKELAQERARREVAEMEAARLESEQKRRADEQAQ